MSVIPYSDENAFITNLVNIFKSRLIIIHEGYIRMLRNSQEYRTTLLEKINRMLH